MAAHLPHLPHLPCTHNRANIISQVLFISVSYVPQVFTCLLCNFLHLPSMHLLGDTNRDDEYDPTGVFEPVTQDAALEGRILILTFQHHVQHIRNSYCATPCFS
jgi:hypothetical protein